MPPTPLASAAMMSTGSSSSGSAMRNVRSKYFGTFGMSYFIRGTFFTTAVITTITAMQPNSTALGPMPAKMKRWVSHSHS